MSLELSQRKRFVLGAKRAEILGYRSVAEIGPSCHALAMTRSRLLFPMLALSLGSCSYTYDLRAVVIGGRLAFDVDPASRHDASCINQIDVIAASGARAKPAPGDDVSRVQSGTFWHQRLDYDCVDAFPIFYGQKLKGKPSPLGQALEAVSAKPLKVGLVYEVTTTTGATGYGGGAFKILPDHSVINVPQPPLVDANDIVAPAAGNGGYPSFPVVRIESGAP